MKKFFWIIAGCTGITALTILGLLYKNEQWRKIFPPCPFFKWTGIYCPGCGSTRATYYLLHGDLAGVFRSNPLYLPAFLFILAMVIFPEKITVRWYWGCLVVVILYWIMRNLPWFPFILLAPSPLR